MQEPKMTEKEYMKLMSEIHSNLINIQSITDKIERSGGWAFPKVLWLSAQQLSPKQKSAEVYLISSEDLAAEQDPFGWKMPSVAKPYKTESARGLQFFIGSVRFYDQQKFKVD